MNVLTVVGNRPQFIKAAAVSGPLRQAHHEVLIHTGQHFDEELSRVFFTELGLPSPDRELGIARGSNTSQTARMLAALEPVIGESPRLTLVLVYGDTNSTLAGALAAAQARIPVAHVEAGMRSFDRTMPEELNRVLADHASALLLCSSEVAVANLRARGSGGRIELVGDVMVDVALSVQPSARERIDLVRAHGLAPGEYVLATAHRLGQRRPARPARARWSSCSWPVPHPCCCPLHPRTHARLRAAGLLERLQRSERLTLTPPLGYVELTALLCNARGGVHRLRRASEGGLPGRRALHHAAQQRPSGSRRSQTGWNVLVDLDIEAALPGARARAAGGAPAALRRRPRRRARRGRAYTASRMRPALR